MSGRPALSTNVAGALWMVAGAATYTVSVTLVKFLGDEYPASLQAVYHRGASLLFLLPLILRNPRAAFRTTRLGLVFWRAGAGTISLILALYAYQHLPFAEANALSFTRALWMVPLAMLMLGEKVGPRRLIATIVGFGGVLLILQPDGGTQAILPVAASLTAALLTAFSISGTKIMTRDHGTTVLLVWTATLGFLFAIPPALFVWRWPSPIDLVLLGGIGIFATLTQACSIKGMSSGDATAMAPLDYTRVIFAIGVGYFIFSEVPNALAMAGVAVIALSTLYLTWRETKGAAAKLESERVELTGGPGGL